MKSLVLLVILATSTESRSHLKGVIFSQFLPEKGKENSCRAASNISQLTICVNLIIYGITLSAPRRLFNHVYGIGVNG